MPGFHDALGIFLQDLRQGEGRARHDDGHVGVLLDDHWQRAGMISMGVGDEDEIRAASFADQLQIGQLAVGDTSAAARRYSNASIDQDARAANVEECAARADFIRTAQEGDFHRVGSILL